MKIFKKRAPQKSPAAHSDKNQPMDQQKPDNIGPYISSASDIDLFVDQIALHWYIAHRKDTDDDVSILTRSARQLLWIIANYLNKEVRPDERTVDTMLKILGVCAQTSRFENSPFDFMIEGCRSESLKEKYAYFQYQTFGFHSNCYRETVQQCTEALQELSFENLVKAIEAAKKELDKEGDNPHKEPQPLFGELIKHSGQALQVEQSEKYLTAIHEASHAVAYYLLKLPFYGVTIISTNEAGGALRSKYTDQYDTSKYAISLYAGAAGELAILNPVFPRVWYNGSDVQQATKIIKQEVINELSKPRDAYEYIFIDADTLGLADEESPYIIYETIKRCVALRQEAIDLITEHKDMVAALAEELLKRQSMPSEEVIQFLDEWQFNHDPQKGHSVASRVATP